MFTFRQSDLLLFLSLQLTLCGAENKQYANTWVVELHEHMSDQEVDKIARDLGFENIGKIFDDDKLWSFKHPRVTKRSVNLATEHHVSLTSHVEVRSAEQEVILKRVKRDHQVEPRQDWDDSSWSQMWYLKRAVGKSCENNPPGCFDMNVIPAWKKKYTGRGVSVTILDDGIERTHPDLQANYDPYASYDINDNDHDPMLRYDYTNENRHGTRCAGEVAAIANNGNCAVGVAYNAKIGGVRMLDGDVTDSVEARSLKVNRTYVDIYSASWGPDDNGRTVDGPGKLAKVSFSDGVKLGRNGKGNIFMWASGNGGNYQDSCACDGYCNSIYTLSVSSAQENNQPPWYLEECASTLATTYSSGANYGMKKIVTTDLHHRCTDSHTGTSASAPLAAGLVAQMLSANLNLGWRDVQYIVMMTSRSQPLITHGGFLTNGAHRNYSHKFGYGLMDAAAMCDMAANWTNVPTQALQFSTPVRSDVRKFGETYTETINVAGCLHNGLECTNIRYLEHVQIELTVGASHRGNLKIILTSPHGTKSTVLPYRRSDTTSAQFSAWPFLSVHFWGENPIGDWKYEVLNGEDKHVGEGVLTRSRLILHGLTTDPTNTTHITCHRLCDKSMGCTGEGANDCGKCNSAAFLLKGNGTCVTECPLRYYGTEMPDKRCEICPHSCMNCTSSTYCTGCIDNYYLNTDNLCVDQCPGGLFADSVTHTCKPCNETCLRCSDEKTCVFCKPGWELAGNQCTTPCKPGEYRDSYLKCQKCSGKIAHCQTCATETGGSAPTCHLCDVEYLLYNNTCVPGCPSKTYKNVTAQSCNGCHPSCASCYEGRENNCLSCTEGKLTLENRCIEEKSCEPAEFVQLNGTCKACNGTCLSCTGPDVHDCSSCSGNTYLKDGMCVTECGGGFYASDSNGQTCERCHSSCLTCTDSLPDSCILCDLYHEDINIHDHDSAVQKTRNCQTKCLAGQYLYVCNKTNPNSFCNETLSECRNCSQSCETCVGMKNTDCKSCNASNFLTAEGRCAPECPERTFPIQNFPHPSICSQCHIECENCSGAGEDQCTSCMDGRILTTALNNEPAELPGKCVELSVLEQSCFTDQYFNQTSLECRQCAYTCKSCNGPSISQCTTCRDDRRLDAGQCVKCCDKDVLKPTDLCTICTNDKAVRDSELEHEKLKNKLVLTLVIVMFILIVLFLTIFAVLQYCVTGRCWKSDKNLTFSDHPTGHIKYSQLQDQDQEDVLYSADDGLIKSQNGYTQSSRWRNSTFDSD